MISILINHKNAIASTIILSMVFVFTAEDVLAFEQLDTHVSKIITPGDLYIESKEPIHVSFNITAIDKFDNQIFVECDKASNSVFYTGKTTVRCAATEPSGEIMRESFVITVGYNIIQIPDWFKKTTSYWTSQTMSDDEYYKTLGFLLDEKVIHMPQTKILTETTHSEIPKWIKTNAEKWINEELSDDEFSIVLQWILRNSSIQVLQ